MTPNRRILIVEPDLWAHHAFWLSLIIKGSLAAGYEVHVLTQPDEPQFREQLRLQAVEPSTIKLHSIAGQDEAGLVRQASGLADRYDCGRVFFAFLDRFLPLLIKAPAAWEGLRGKITGIWFHPHALDAVWRWCPPLDKRSALRGRLHRFFRTPKAAELFQACILLDPWSVERLRSINPRIQSELITDPYEREPALDQRTARERLSLPLDRPIFLHFGSPEKRKGLPDVLAAFGRLKSSGRRPLLLRVGPNERLCPQDRQRLNRLIQADLARVVDSFVPSEAVMDYFIAVDWVLIPYRSFRFSSGILANAIGARRPVIASDYGYIGRTVAERSLGLVYAHGSVRGLHGVLSRALASSPGRDLIDSNCRDQRSPSEWLAAYGKIMGFVEFPASKPANTSFTS